MNYAQKIAHDYNFFTIPTHWKGHETPQYGMDRMTITRGPFISCGNAIVVERMKFNAKIIIEATP